MTPAELFNHARGNSLDSYQQALCLREIERLNGGGTRARLETHSDESAAIYLRRHYPITPDFTGKCVEDVLIAAYDDLLRLIADEQADGVAA